MVCYDPSGCSAPHVHMSLQSAPRFERPQLGPASDADEVPHGSRRLPSQVAKGREPNARRDLSVSRTTDDSRDGEELKMGTTIR